MNGRQWDFRSKFLGLLNSLIDVKFGKIDQQRNMRFTLQPSEWILEFLNTAEWYFVYELPKLASGEPFTKEIRDQALPAPIVDSDGNPIHTEDTEDWDEFVKPDILDGFAAARAVVIADIDAAEKTDNPSEWLHGNEDLPEGGLEGPLWRVRVTMDNTEAWYSTLNQCRILMNKAHDLADDESRIRSAIFGEIDENIPQDKALLLAQYEFYCVIQNILVENIMN